MAQVVVEGVCLPVTGYEEDYLDFGDDICGITDLIARAGGVVARWDEATAFCYPGEPHWLEQARAFRSRTGRQSPPTYRVKITVEIEESPAVEIEDFWRKKAAP